jgi:uncharacterized protein with NAD-binding domain and iron-sulfur cluster
MPPPKPKVAILGGGTGGLTAAFDLSRGDWKKRFESITVYQYGWRLGGKGASGRGEHGRIEEHGLHIWLGFYENAFQIMRECYEELGRAPGKRLRRVEEAFERASFFIVTEQRGPDWIPWMSSFPEDDGFPGEGEAHLPSLWECLVRALELSWEFMASVGREPGDNDGPPAGVHVVPGSGTPTGAIVLTPADPGLVASAGSALGELWDRLTRAIELTADAALAAALVLATTLDEEVGLPDWALDRICELVERASDWFHWRRPPPDRLSDEARRQFYLGDILLASVRGVLVDGLLTDPRGLDAIDDYDFIEWLIRHGADPESARCALVMTVVYDLQFAYRDGDPTQPACSAATALRGLIRLFLTYRGAIAWKMRAGMGDVVFAPLWQVLHARGVRFEFFHRVDALHLSPDGRRIGSIDVTRQVDLRNPGAEYRPLVDVEQLPCWPSRPLTAQLANAGNLEPEEVESFWSTRATAGQRVLKDGIDYDVVVLAIPVGAHPYICQELINHSPAWADMGKIGTIYTQAFQLWLSASMEELGCDWPPATTGGYLEPFDTYADMRQLIEVEKWPGDRVRGIAYFCNAMPTPPGVPSPADVNLPIQARNDVKQYALAFLRNEMPPLWPRGVKRYPTDFRWELLVGSPNSVTGAQRFDSQFWVANVDPSERYVLPLPGTARYRLEPHQSGYDNLYLAGDWTECGLNAGCVEAAVISGRVAAHAIEGGTNFDDIVGYRHL